MIDERREAQASVYVLGALAPPERREFEAALRADPDLQKLVHELRGTATAMVAAFPRVQPPPALKSKIFAAIDAPAAGSVVGLPSGAESAPPWMAWMPWAMAACFAILCVVLISLGHRLRQQAVVLNDQLGEKSEEAAELKKQFEMVQSRSEQQKTNFQERILNIERDAVKRIEDLGRQTAAFTNRYQNQQAEAQKQLNFYRNQAEQLRGDKKALEEALASGGAPPANNRFSNARAMILRPTDPQARTLGAAVWLPQDQRVLVTLENLSPAAPNQSYQLWLIDPQLKSPVSAGVFPLDASGSVRLQFSPVVHVDSAERLAISIEPRGGSATPTGRIVMASN